jgi:predicted DNA-binding transcriptional regulator YafY
VTTATRLARELEVSERTIYRDVQDLIGSGVPIQGEAGVGYALPRGFDIPPMMFTVEEIEALVLGARIVSSWTDPTLARAATEVLTKIEAVLPERLKPRFEHTAMFAPRGRLPPAVLSHLALIRASIADQQKMRISYARPDGQRTERTVHPVGLFFWGAVWTMVGWCELRNDFRTFRLDRMKNTIVLEEKFQPGPGRLLSDFLSYVAATIGKTPQRTP